MNKFANNVSVEEDPNYQAWLDFQEVADLRVMEAEEVKVLARTRAFAGIIAKTARRSPTTHTTVSGSEPASQPNTPLMGGWQPRHLAPQARGKVFWVSFSFF